MSVGCFCAFVLYICAGISIGGWFGICMIMRETTVSCPSTTVSVFVIISAHPRIRHRVLEPVGVLAVHRFLADNDDFHRPSSRPSPSSFRTAPPKPTTGFNIPRIAARCACPSEHSPPAPSPSPQSKQYRTVAPKSWLMLSPLKAAQERKAIYRVPSNLPSWKGRTLFGSSLSRRRS